MINTNLLTFSRNQYLTNYFKKQSKLTYTHNPVSNCHTISFYTYKQRIKTRSTITHLQRKRGRERDAAKPITFEVSYLIKSINIVKNDRHTKDWNTSLNFSQFTTVMTVWEFTYCERDAKQGFLQENSFKKQPFPITQSRLQLSINTNDIVTQHSTI